MFPSEENKTQYKRIRNQTRKIAATAMRMEADQKLNDYIKILTGFSTSLEK